MWVLLISLLVLGLVAALLGWWRNRVLSRKLERGEIEALPTIKQPADSGCCGQHIVCEKTALLAGLSKDIVYFDDEELDRFAGVPADAYLPADEDEFREVFYTMRPGEVVEWVRSLELRHIEIPNGIKDEIFMMIRQ